MISKHKLVNGYVNYFLGKLNQNQKVKIYIFKALALWADAFYKSKCPSVCLCVCVSVCPSVHF